MNDLQIRRWNTMPLVKEEVWQCDIVRMRTQLADDAGKAFQPVMPMWISVRHDQVQCGELVPPQERNLALAVNALLDFALKSEFGGYRPGTIEVRDAALAERLDELLADTGIAVKQVETLAALRAAVTCHGG